METKVCKRCNVERGLDRYTQYKRTGNYAATCKDCFNEQQRRKRQDPTYREKERLQRAEYRARPEIKARREAYNAEYRARPESKQRMQEYHKEWYQKNREHKIAIGSEYERQRFANDEQYRMRKCLSARMRSFVKSLKNGNDTARKNADLNFLGCTLAHFREWIESLFDPKMSWDNYGSYWHFDHIKPLASFDLLDEDQRKECFNWRNTRPVEKITNMRKKDNIDDELIRRYNEFADLFENRFNLE